MQWCYEICCEKHNIGYATVEQYGLYYSVICHIQPREKRMYRVFVQTQGNVIDLGICVPEKNGFCIRTKIRVKDFDTNSAVFSVVENRNTSCKIADNEEFPYLYMLRSAHLAETECCVAVFFQEAL